MIFWISLFVAAPSFAPFLSSLKERVDYGSSRPAGHVSNTSNIGVTFTML